MLRAAEAVIVARLSPAGIIPGVLLVGLFMAYIAFIAATAGRGTGHAPNAASGRLLTNLAFGGRDNRDLFISGSSTGCIQRATVPRPGLTLFSHR